MLTHDLNVAVAHKGNIGVGSRDPITKKTKPATSRGIQDSLWVQERLPVCQVHVVSSGARGVHQEPQLPAFCAHLLGEPFQPLLQAGGGPPVALLPLPQHLLQSVSLPIGLLAHLLQPPQLPGKLLATRVASIIKFRLMALEAASVA